MTKKILFLHPWKFYPAIAGNRRRSFEVLVALRDIGYQVTVIGDKGDWLKEEGGSSELEDFRQKFCSDVRLFERFPLSPSQITKMGRLYRMYGLLKKTPSDITIDSLFFKIRKWVTQVAEEVSPDVLFSTYLQSDTLIDHAHLNKIHRVIDTVDLFTLNQRMWSTLSSRFPADPIDPQQVDEEILGLDFFDKMNLTADPKEYQTYNKYDHTIAIVRQEADAIQQNTKATRVSAIPMMLDPVVIENNYSGDAFLPGGPNPYNLQGILFFLRYVLPLVRAQQPDFCLHVCGPITKSLIPQEGLRLSTFTDLKQEYRSACFLLCPVFSGTGQQVKITEAMAHGVPVAALRSAAERTSLKHNYSGLVANSAKEYAEHIVQLWRDRNLCRRLGQAGRATIAENYSQQQLRDLLEEALRPVRS
jgi:hypothetical protein